MNLDWLSDVHKQHTLPNNSKPKQKIKKTKIRSKQHPNKEIKNKKK